MEDGPLLGRYTLKTTPECRQVLRHKWRRGIRELKGPSGQVSGTCGVERNLGRNPTHTKSSVRTTKVVSQSHWKLVLV